MAKIFAWIKNNKLASFLLLVVVYLLFKKYYSPIRPLYLSAPANYYHEGAMSLSPSTAVGSAGMSKGSVGQLYESAPKPEVTDRMVVEESYVSMVVDQVRETVDQVITKATSVGGYMVSSSISQPMEAPFANLVIRVPVRELRPMLAYLRGLAVKVTSENILGEDVTDQYFDIEERLSTLNKTKAKFEEIMSQAVRIEDLLIVQRELINLQDQIDSLKGRQNYLEKTAENARLTVYLSSDEWSLPYAPEEGFRPKVIFKQAVRALVTTLRGLLSKAIWVGVYGAIWLPILLIILILRRIRRRG